LSVSYALLQMCRQPGTSFRQSILNVVDDGQVKAQRWLIHQQTGFRPWNKWAYLRGGAPTDRQTAAETCLQTWVTRRVWKSLGQPPENCGNAHSHFPQNVCWVMEKENYSENTFSTHF